MPDWADDVSDWQGLMAILLAILTIVGYLIRAEVRREMKPNHGSSLRDAVDRIEEKLDRHIDWHMEGKDK